MQVHAGGRYRLLGAKGGLSLPRGSPEYGCARTPAEPVTDERIGYPAVVSDQEEKVLVPALVGLQVSEAHELAFEARVVVVAADPDEPLPVTGTVIAQAPGAGTRVAPAHPVAIAVETGGGGGGGRRLTTPPPGPRDPSGSKTPA
jgi:hypothetical protein